MRALHVADVGGGVLAVSFGPKMPYRMMIKRGPLKYSDRFLRALGAWQNGWREEAYRRLPITDELLAAIRELGPGTLPETAGHLTCYRKRFLVPNNPQNGGDFWKLLMDGSIEEGVASWTTDQGFSRVFKDLARAGSVTAIFEHKPTREEIILDIVALWGDAEFHSAAQSYKDRSGEYADALIGMGGKQYEIILRAPLLREEAIDFIGFASDEDYFFDTLGADTEEAKDVVWREFANIGTFPGEPRWTGRSGAQRAIAKVRVMQEVKYTHWIYRKYYKTFLNDCTALTQTSNYRSYLKGRRLL